MSELINYIESLPDKITKGIMKDEYIQKAQEELGLKFNKDYIEVLKTYGLLFTGKLMLTTYLNSNFESVIYLTDKMRGVYPELDKNLYVLSDLQTDGMVLLQNESGQVYLLDYDGYVGLFADDLLSAIKKVHEGR